jgi:ABC-type xylose transport system permease subunit
VPVAAFGLIVGGSAGTQGLGEKFHEGWKPFFLHLGKGYFIAIVVGLVLGFVLGFVHGWFVYRKISA